MLDHQCSALDLDWKGFLGSDFLPLMKIMEELEECLNELQKIGKNTREGERLGFVKLE
jgi:hypothetical protein